MRVLKALNGVKNIDDQIEREAMRSSGIIEEEFTQSATLVKITFENVAIIEAMISYDSKYSRNSDPRSIPDKKWIKEFKDKLNMTSDAPEPLGPDSPASLEYNFNGYRGSSAFWMHRLGEYYGYDYGDEFEIFDSIKTAHGIIDSLFTMPYAQSMPRIAPISTPTKSDEKSSRTGLSKRKTIC